MREAGRLRSNPRVPSLKTDQATIPLRLRTQQNHHILVHNWGSRVTAILRTLDTYRDEQFAITLVSSRSTEFIQQAIARYAPDLRHVHVHVIQGDPVFPHEIPSLRLTDYSSILFVASDRFDDTESSDARTLVSFLRLRNLLPKDGVGSFILVEVLDPHDSSFYERTEEAAVLVSPDIASHALAQIALRPDLNVIYNDLTSGHATDIGFVPLTDIVPGDSEVTFERIVAASVPLGMIPIGTRHEGELVLNPPRHSMWPCRYGVEVAVIARRASHA